MRKTKYCITVALGILMFTGCAAKSKCAAGNPGIECINGDRTNSQVKNITGSYEAERSALMTKLVKTPPTPMRAPDTILRVLVLPYVNDKGVLTTQSYKFVKVDDGKWILGEYLTNEGGQIGELTPLSGNIKDDVKPQTPNKKDEVE